MKEKILDIVICPNCQEFEFKILIERRSDLEIREGKLRCESCGFNFLIKKGILFFHTKLSRSALNEGRALNKEISQKKLVFSQDDKWLLNFPRSQQLDIEQRADRMMKVSANNSLIFIKRLNQPGKKKRILEIGAGNCWLSAKLAEDHEVVALDVFTPFPKGLEAAEVFIKHRNIYFERIKADMIKIPFKDRSFDIVLFSAALHHSSDLKRTLKDIYRILAPDGRIVLLNEPSKGLFGSRERERVTRDLEDGIEENRYTIQEWKAAFKVIGFRHKAYLPSNFSEVLKTRGGIFYFCGFLLELIPFSLRKIIMNASKPVILFLFDGFFNAIIYKNKV
ncbi:hypothetical protein COV49_03870 [Candidatus Falkowbacteria bacterium CG11_big_fil_rev_8_21_14_0_20_39_10]|uniref:Methyltransferase type 11 domain-containing protein n=1 Tax=Candidatus Falkowbacteria bacterium CG11_big_fil_rev_8_21_14_0_20_39_10 TaxID=1974570 RepID=A0A2M6K8B4_9BACT|nr:MAG: hypothetical protein COV49_03870 [Candidatus Falkowbacteria bacterium CG11_big_fil_rev_8_21_14_0_20_39_10]